MVATVLLLLLLATLGYVLFKQLEYGAWRTQLIQTASKSDILFAILPLSQQEQILDDELKKMTGQTGYMSYLMFPRYNFDLDVEIIEGVEIPIHIAFDDAMATAFRLLVTILEAIFAYGTTFYAFFNLHSE